MGIRWLILFSFGILLLLWASIFLPTHRDAPSPALQEAGVPVILYAYDPARDVDADGTILCSAAGLVPLARMLPAKVTVVDAVQLLLRGELTAEERVQGITTEFPLPGLSLRSAVQKDGILVLTFDDPQHQTSGGACRAGILWQQVQATAQRFGGAAQVRFEPEDLFQP